jgi:hypothetical protein
MGRLGDPDDDSRVHAGATNFPRNAPGPLVSITVRLNFRKVALSLQPIQPACGFSAGALLLGCGPLWHSNLVVALNIL